MFIEVEPFVPSVGTERPGSEFFDVLREIVAEYRPVLDRRGWAKWNYPAKDARDVRVASAQVIIDLAGWLLDQDSAGRSIEDAQGIAQLAIEMLKGLDDDEFSSCCLVP